MKLMRLVRPDHPRVIVRRMARILVVGSNRGIGLEICKQLAGRGDEVVAACRTASAELENISGVTVKTGVDVSKEASIAKFRDTCGEPFDWLLVVAGIMRRTALDDFDLKPSGTNSKLTLWGSSPQRWPCGIR